MYDGMVEVVPAVALVIFDARELERVVKEGRGRGCRKGMDVRL